MIRVELIDDHEMIVQSIARLLRDEPEIVVVGTALDATTGIELARVERPDVIIIDYSLPDMEAPSAIRILRTVCPEARIITVSGSEKPGAFYESLRAGSSAWVTKTRAIQELRDAIIRVAAGHPVLSEVWDSLPDLDDLVVHYQPVVEFTSGRTIGFEASFDGSILNVGSSILINFLSSQKIRDSSLKSTDEFGSWRHIN